MKKVKALLLKKWRYITIYVILIVLLITIFILFKVNHASGIMDALTNTEILSKVYYITQIMTSIAVIIGGVIGIWQYTLTTRAERIKMNVDRIQKAIDLAEYYKINILDNYSVIYSVFQKCDLLKIINKIDREK
ncbi:MAG: hypothetical protein J1E64_08870 [Acetatifactor sp.]|nr:hypothetical protein [Acetatifactor sp.]